MIPRQLRKKIPVQHPVYSWEYSREVVDQFLKDYARVTIHVGKLLGLSPTEMRESLVKAFRYHNTRWKVLRETLKYIDKEGLPTILSRLGREDRLVYLTAVRSLVEDDMIDGEKL